MQSEHFESSRSASFDLTFRRLGAVAVVCAVLLGSISLSSASIRWVALATALHLAPLAVQLVPRFRIAGAWLAVFLIAQATVSVIVLPAGVLSLPTNVVRTFVIPFEVVPGLSGRQTITTDQKGFRVTRAIDYERKGSGTLRIFAIGGSTTEQHLLDDHRTWTHLLQEKLQAQLDSRTVEVINAGTQGTRAVHHLAVLQSIAKYHPDVVLFLVGFNDWNKHIREHFGSDAYGRWQGVRVRLQFENTLFGRGIRRASDGARELAGQEIRVSGGGWSEGQAGSLERSDRRALVIDGVADDYVSVLASIAAECKRQKTICAFLTQPHAYQLEASAELRKRFWMTPTYEDYTLDFDSLIQIANTYNRYLVEFAKAHEMASCDVAAAVTSPSIYFWDDCHMTEAGARVFASTLATCLLEDVLPVPSH